MFQKKKPLRNEAYLDFVRRQTCVLTGAPYPHAHHVRLGNDGGMGLKPSDYRTIPLAPALHTTSQQGVHSVGEERFYEKHQMKPDAICIALLAKFIGEKCSESELKQVLEHMELIVEGLRQ